MRQFVEQSIGIVTALVPVIGYETVDRDRARGAGERPWRVRARDGARAADARAARPRAQSRDDDAAAVHLRGARRAIAARPDGRTTTQADRPGAVRAAGRADPRRASSATRTSTAPAPRCAPRDASPRVTWQVSAKRDGWLGGIDEAVALLKLCSDDFAALDGARALRGRPRRGLGHGDDRRGRLRRLRAPRDARSSARWRGARASAPTLRTLVDAARPKPVYLLRRARRPRRCSSPATA